MLASNVDIATLYTIDVRDQFATNAKLGTAWSLTPPAIDLLLGNGGKITSFATPSCLPLPVADAPAKCMGAPHLTGCYSNVNADGKYCCLEATGASGNACGDGSSSWFPGWSNPTAAYIGDRRVSFVVGTAASGKYTSTHNRSLIYMDVSERVLVLPASVLAKQMPDGSFEKWVPDGFTAEESPFFRVRA